MTWPLITVSSRLAEVMSREDIRGGGFFSSRGLVGGGKLTSGITGGFLKANLYKELPQANLSQSYGLVVVGAAPLVAGTAWTGVSNCRPPEVVTAATEATAEATAAAFFIFCFSRNLRIISPLRWEGGACGSLPALVRLLFGRVLLSALPAEGGGCGPPPVLPTGGPGGFCKGGCCCICC